MFMFSITSIILLYCQLCSIISLKYNYLQLHAQTGCQRILKCGHLCGGIKGETKCLPCLHGCDSDENPSLKQDADDMCMICFTDALSAAPSIQV